jgi:hypothetical protein
MSTTNSAIKLTRTLQEQAESRVILFGNPSDPEVAASMRKLKNVGREVHTRPRANFDTGLGQCGHLCHCKGPCLDQYLKHPEKNL